MILVHAEGTLCNYQRLNIFSSRRQFVKLYAMHTMHTVLKLNILRNGLTWQIVQSFDRIIRTKKSLWKNLLDFFVLGLTFFEMYKKPA